MAIKTRPPIVAVLGHVDHGKTTLISKIKEIDLTEKEHGGISQHIGAYQIEHQGKKITFIDTPGHVAFSQMRSRGAQVADLIVLVVAADEGVKPQTLESLKHIQAAKIPYLVAINKIDLADVNLDWVKKNLAENDILVEGYGGEIVAVPVSAKTGKGVDQLLEMILFLAEMAELEADAEGPLEAVTIESKLDPQTGPTATILVRNGSLRVGDEIMAENIKAKVKAIFDEKGRKIETLGPSQPGEILGFSQVPPVGAKISLFSEAVTPLMAGEKPTVESKTPEDKEKKLKVILKADTGGTLEAILGSFPEEVEFVHSDVGNINESDVLLATTTGAELIGFNVKAPSGVKKLAETEGVKLKTYKIIYELLGEIEKRVLKILEPTIDEEILGEAEIVAEFEIRKERIAGCKVRKGQISKQDKLHLKRKERIIGDCRIRSMKTGKRDIEKAKMGGEFGAILSPNLDFQIGDVLVSYRPLREEK